MNWLDIVIIVIAALFGMVGLWRGAIKTSRELPMCPYYSYESQCGGI